MDFELKPRPLKIAFLGYTANLTNKGLKRFAEDNKEEVYKLKRKTSQPTLILKDGTTIIGISHSEILRGHKFDQLILFDDERWDIYREKADVIDRIVEETMFLSYVPEEFQILEYEYSEHGKCTACDGETEEMSIEQKRKLGRLYFEIGRLKKKRSRGCDIEFENGSSITSLPYKNCYRGKSV